jgi:hypothetical protein
MGIITAIIIAISSLTSGTVNSNTPSQQVIITNTGSNVI